MKKIIAITILVGLGLFLGATQVFGAITYERTPSDFEIQNPVNFYVRFDNFEDSGCSASTTHYSLYIMGALVEPPAGIHLTPHIPKTTLENLWIINLELGERRGVMLECYEEENSLGYTEQLEEGSPAFIVTELVCDNEHLELCLTEITCSNAGGYWYNDICNVLPEPPPPPFFGITENFVTGSLAYIGQAVTGLSPLLYVIIGVPLGFYVIRKIMGVMPKK